jgi:zinc/manganese transport system substrate-binding protein
MVSAMIFAAAWGSLAADDRLVSIVAAHNFYGDVAKQLGGDRVAVVSVLNNPDQDPHFFEMTPAIARRIADARIVIYNGLYYDPWMQKLLDATNRPGRAVIVAAAVVGRKAGDNPHLWYDPATMPAIARAVTEALSKADPAHTVEYDARLGAFINSMLPLEQKIADMRAKYAGTSIAATESVFGYMANAIGLTMRNERFQMAVMNGTEPAARDLAAFENDLRKANVGALLHNVQVTSGLANRLIGVAQAADIPVVGITESKPADVTYVDWMLRELGDLDRALQRPRKSSVATPP